MVEVISEQADEAVCVPKVSGISRPYDFKERMEMRRTLDLMNSKSGIVKYQLRNAPTSGHHLHVSFCRRVQRAL